LSQLPEDVKKAADLLTCLDVKLDTRCEHGSMTAFRCGRNAKFVLVQEGEPVVLCRTHAKGAVGWEEAVKL